ncbi:hypothetical protein FRC03_010056 [Tulasnella sp. 419]|nr:hypothetical protein FRC03_010056 [Tulasnella sp. 419]
MFSSLRSHTSFESDRSNSDLPPLYTIPSSSRRPSTASSSSSSATYSPLRELELSPTLESDSPLPLYSNCPASDEVVLDAVLRSQRSTQSEQDGSSLRYKYKSSRMKLDLGPRGKGAAYTHCPSYGSGGVVEGFVDIKSLSHVEKVELKIEGIITLAATERGYVSSAGTKNVFSHTEIVYTNDDPAFAGKSDLRHDFSFPLPSQCSGSSDPLPPSSYLMFPGVECHVAYHVKVDMFKKGFRRHETVETAILYLPKTSPPARRSESSQYNSASSSSGLPDEKAAFTYTGWKTSILTSAEPSDAVKDLLIEMALQRPLSYPSRRPIPVRLIFANSSDPIIPDLIASSAEISLYRMITLTINGRPVRREQLIGKGKFGKAIRQSKENDVVIAEGSVVGGKPYGEVTWQVDGVVSVDYAVRVEVKPSQSLEGVIPCYTRTETIALTTHSWEESFHRDGILEGPALGIIGRPVHVASN